MIPLAGINRFFLAAMAAAVLYFLGEFIATNFLGGHERLQLLVVGLFILIHIPAVPFVAVFPRMSPTLMLFIACLGWGAIGELGYFVYRRVRARRLLTAGERVVPRNSDPPYARSGQKV